MLVNSTYSNKDNEKLINDIVGKPYSFFKAIKIGGIGSKRMIVESVSPNLMQYINKVSDLNYANIELRPKGIIIHINKQLETFSWIIPFYQLVLYKVNGSSIHAQGKFIRFKNNTTFKENKAFFGKLLDEKVKYDMQYNFENIT